MTQLDFNWSEDKFITLNHINQLLSTLRMRNYKTTSLINISFSTKVVAIDEVFFSYLLLINANNKNIFFKLHFDKKSSSLVFKIKNIVSYLDLVIKTPEGNPIIEIVVNGILQKVQINTPSRYIPNIFISKENTNWIITNDLEPFILQTFRLLNKNSHTEKVKKEIFLKEFKSKSGLFDNSSPLNNSKSLNLRVYIEIFIKLNILYPMFKIFLNTGYKSIFDESLSKEESKNMFFLPEERRFFQLNTFQLFLFKSLFDQLWDDHSKKPMSLELIKSALKYVLDIEKGVDELRKNIIEHAGIEHNLGNGVISGRVFTYESLNDIKNYGNSFKDWLSENKVNKKLFVEINVIDLGTSALLDKYLQSLQNEFSETSTEDTEIKDIFRKDIAILENSPINLSALFNFNEIILNHQALKINARVGLLRFSNILLKEKKGFLKLANKNKAYALRYTDGIVNTEDISKNSESNDQYINQGTNYSFIFPIEEHQEINDSQPELSNEPIEGLSTSVFTQLLKFKEREGLVFRDISIIENSEKTKYQIIREIVDSTIFNLETDKILVLNFEKVNELKTSVNFYDPSTFLRFLAYLNLNNSTSKSIPIIITGLPLYTYIDFLKILNIYGGFWSENNPILFFFKIQYLDSPFWFNSVLFGDSDKTFLSINNHISKYHYNISQIENFEFLSKMKDESFNFNYPNKSIFFDKNKLLNFELLIQNQERETLFEQTLKSLLNLEIRFTPKEENEISIEKRDFFENLQGYKIKDSHFKLGSKIHIKDFYYAKRLFYNSYYTSRIAFLMANFIVESGKYQLDSKFTIVGYSYYSELLVNTIRNYLFKIGFKKVNHDLILENDKFLKNQNNVHEEIILVIPISSTFSTSFKLKVLIHKLKNDNKKHWKASYKIADLNALAIGNSGFPYSETNISSKNLGIYNKFNWHDSSFLKSNLESKVIYLKNPSYDEAPLISQKYFIGLESEWHLNYDCKLCYPKPSDNLSESCLLETDRNSVTPDLNFDLPVFKKIEGNISLLLKYKSLANKISNNTNITEEYNSLVVSKEYVKKVNTTAKYFIRSGRFLKLYKIDVDRWLKKNKNLNHLKTKNNVVLVTPSISSHSGFVSLFNEVIFQETATILQFNPSEDNIFNFKKFHQSILKDSYVVYVDDVISSTKSFYAIQNYIEFSINKKIDACFCMINRMSFIDQEKISKLFTFDQDTRFDSFININLPFLSPENKNSKYIPKNEFFQNLAQKSSLDIIRVHFKKLEKKYTPVDLDSKSQRLVTDVKSLFKFLVLQEITQYFTSITTNISDDFVFKIISRVKEGKLISIFLKDHFSYIVEVESQVLRLLSEEPFVSYKGIKEKTFEYVLVLTKSLSNDILKGRVKVDESFFNLFTGNDSASYTTLEYSTYHKYKFYLFLCKNLKINYLLSIDVLRCIGKIIAFLSKTTLEFNSKRLIVKDTNTTYIEYKPINHKTIYPIGLSAYYTGLVQEVIIEDEAKAFQLIKNIRNITVGDDTLHLQNLQNNEFSNFLKLLVLENIYVLQSYHELFFKSLSINEINMKFSYSFNAFEEKFKQFKTIERFDAIEKVLSKFEERENIIYDKLDTSLIEPHKFIMYIKTLMVMDVQGESNNEYSISDKINTILAYACKALGINSENANNGGGAFMVVRYNNLGSEKLNANDLYKIGEFYTDEEHNLKTEEISKNSVLLKIFEGLDHEGEKSPRSSFEINWSGKSEDTGWDFRKRGLNDDFKNFVLNSQELEGSKVYKNLYFLRIAKVKPNKNEESNKEKPFIQDPYAVLCFYKNKKMTDKDYKVELFCPKRIRLILLLRDELLKFVEFHLNNESLKEYVAEVERRRFSSSLSHGMETIENIFKESIESYGNAKKQKEKIIKKEELKIAKSFLISKIELINNFYGKNVLFKSTYSVKELVEKFKVNINFILFSKNFKGSHLFYNEELIMVFDNIEEYKNYTFSIPVYFLNDLIFELIYNIRKHILRSKKQNIDLVNKLIVGFRIGQNEDGHNMFYISNNFATTADFQSLQTKLNENSNYDGLNIINRIFTENLHLAKLETNFISDNIEIGFPLENFKLLINNENNEKDLNI